MDNSSLMLGGLDSSRIQQYVFYLILVAAHIYFLFHKLYGNARNQNSTAPNLKKAEQKRSDLSQSMESIVAEKAKTTSSLGTRLTLVGLNRGDGTIPSIVDRLKHVKEISKHTTASQIEQDIEVLVFFIRQVVSFKCIRLYKVLPDV
jgi:hypothetical protein